MLFCLFWQLIPDCKLSALSGLLKCSTNGGIHSSSAIKTERSPINHLGRLFFRRQAPWQQRRNMVIVCWTLLVAVLMGGVTVGLMFFANAKH